MWVKNSDGQLRLITATEDDGFYVDFKDLGVVYCGNQKALIDWLEAWGTVLTDPWVFDPNLLPSLP
jgi:hypothetical protein